MNSLFALSIALIVASHIDSTYCFVTTHLQSAAFIDQKFKQQVSTVLSSTSSSAATSIDLSALCSDLNNALSQSSSIIKDAKIKVKPTGNSCRIGLYANTNLGKNEVAISFPYTDGGSGCLNADEALDIIPHLPAQYDGWTGDYGLLAMLLLHEKANQCEREPNRKTEIVELMRAWMAALPTPEEMEKSHPLLWPEVSQDELQGSSTKKIYRLLDDAEEDAVWLEECLWEAHPDDFPEEIFNLQMWKWALAVAYSRAVFLDGMLRIVPIVDIANHGDEFGTVEVQAGNFGMFGTTKGCQIRVGREYKKGEQIFVSYGPKSASEYLLEYGFIPPSVIRNPLAELTFEIDKDDRFGDEKLDILEFDTYGGAMDPIQSFDVGGADGQPDPALVQFLRLCVLGGKDSFILESIFRKEVWDFMAQPMSEDNERLVVEAVIGKVSDTIDDMIEDDDQGAEVDVTDMTPEGLCKVLRGIERKALHMTADYMTREGEALDLKEYYQERRLKDLGLDSEWQEDNPDVGWGQSRAKGGKDLDW